ncbi:RNA polymerase sigma factor [Aquabacterium sp.]|uniref:RNA polymerase sigma factor n=1 Tax=Aquabacterium sp. TaxID=1872578 RepID=UPI002B89572C|nr:RNA polymerase sigma factor [Aquabacterium sp.]HSW03339.1 RNA polymerase sigma factor [Aquabacterium sp.]
MSQLHTPASSAQPVRHAAYVAPRASDRIFGTLVAEHGERLYRFILRRIGDATEAEELAQQAFVEAALGYDDFRGEAQLSTWVYGIALNLVRNHLSRAPSRRYQFEDEDALSELPGHGPDPERQLTLNQQMDLLQRELAELMPEMREVLMLVSLDEMSYEDAAARLAVPVGTVRSRVSRARSRLRERFTAAGASWTH